MSERYIHDHVHFSTQEVSAHILGKMRRVAEDYLGESVDEAIITVPAYFDEVQRQATKDAGTIAGLEVRSILNEPTAAALAYGIHHDQDQRLAVFDLGGGTFDVSILAIESGVFEVLATNGDTDLGGDDFDLKVIELLAAEFQAEHDLDLRQDSVALQRLKEAAERAKIELSSAMSTDINLPFLAVGPAGPLHLQRDITRGEFESVCKELFARLEPPCRQALEQAHCSPADIDQVLHESRHRLWSACEVDGIDRAGRYSGDDLEFEVGYLAEDRTEYPDLVGSSSSSTGEDDCEVSATGSIGWFRHRFEDNTWSDLRPAPGALSPAPLATTWVRSG